MVIWQQRSTPLPSPACRSFHTLIVDLTQPQESILAAIHKDSRYEIRRAEKSDGVSAEYHTQSAELLESFHAFYDEFAQQKGLPKLDAYRLRQYSDTGHLCLTRVVSQDETLVWHAYYRASRRARLLYSASLFRGLDNAQRNRIGRANRYLHWRDMLFFKSAGFHKYDLGGWTPVESGDSEKLRINKFKEEFGGHHVTEFNCIYASSLKGRIVLATKKILRALSARNNPGRDVQVRQEARPDQKSD